MLSYPDTFRAAVILKGILLGFYVVHIKSGYKKI